MHSEYVSYNYAWLPHNQDPSIPTPQEFLNMTVQPFGDRQKFYEDLIKGCRDHYGEQGRRCVYNEDDRIKMNLRQPKVSISG